MLSQVSAVAVHTSGWLPRCLDDAKCLLKPSFDNEETLYAYTGPITPVNSNGILNHSSSWCWQLAPGRSRLRPTDLVGSTIFLPLPAVGAPKSASLVNLVPRLPQKPGHHDEPSPLQKHNDLSRCAQHACRVSSDWTHSPRSFSAAFSAMSNRCQESRIAVALK